MRTLERRYEAARRVPPSLISSFQPITVLVWDGHLIKSHWQNASKRQPDVDHWCYTNDVFGICGDPAEGIKEETRCVYTQVYYLEKESTHIFGAFGLEVKTILDKSGFDDFTPTTSSKNVPAASAPRSVNSKTRS